MPPRWLQSCFCATSQDQDSAEEHARGSQQRQYFATLETPGGVVQITFMGPDRLVKEGPQPPPPKLKLMVDQLPSEDFGQDVTADGPECPICHEKLAAKGSVRLCCGHPFHRRCIRRWLSRQPTCPTCRMELTEEMMWQHVSSCTGQQLPRQAADEQQPDAPRVSTSTRRSASAKGLGGPGSNFAGSQVRMVSLRRAGSQEQMMDTQSAALRSLHEASAPPPSVATAASLASWRQQQQQQQPAMPTHTALSLIDPTYDLRQHPAAARLRPVRMHVGAAAAEPMVPPAELPPELPPAVFSVDSIRMPPPRSRSAWGDDGYWSDVKSRGALRTADSGQSYSHSREGRWSRELLKQSQDVTRSSDALAALRRRLSASSLDSDGALRHRAGPRPRWPMPQPQAPGTFCFTDEPATGLAALAAVPSALQTIASREGGSEIPEGSAPGSTSSRMTPARAVYKVNTGAICSVASVRTAADTDDMVSVRSLSTHHSAEARHRIGPEGSSHAAGGAAFASAYGQGYRMQPMLPPRGAIAEAVIQPPPGQREL